MPLGPTVHVVTHPEVVVEARVPVPDWGLSPVGRERLARLVRMPWVASAAGVASSTERKAVQTAEAVAAVRALPVLVDAGLGENDRSATGFLPPEEFERVADAFFAEPGVSVRGWETAHDAQARVVAAVERVLDAVPGEVVVVTHGGVGTLLLCHLLGVPVSRTLDQPGQGSHFAFDRATRRVLHGWQRV